MVYIIVDEMLLHHPNPNLRQTTVAALNVANEFPDSFQDRADRGHIISTGCASLVKQLKNRTDNVNHGNNAIHQRCARKRKEHEDADDVFESTASARSFNPLDSCGCVNWRLRTLPPGETIASLREAPTALKNQFMLSSERWDTAVLDDSMNKTYDIQRQDINGGCLTAEIIEIWPFVYQQK